MTFDTHATAKAHTDHNHALGSYGETLAADYLRAQGFHLLKKNWRCRYGELDLVMRDGDTVVAVEVKTRSGRRYGSPLEAITSEKAARLRRLLGEWLRESGVSASRLRIDAVGITIDRHEGEIDIDHLRGIS